MIKILVEVRIIDVAASDSRKSKNKGDKVKQPKIYGSNICINTINKKLASISAYSLLISYGQSMIFPISLKILTIVFIIDKRDANICI